MTHIPKFPVLMGLAFVLGLAWNGEAIAGKASVVNVKATDEGYNAFAFSATVSHADTGWDHYANKFEILSPDGKVLGTRVLAHPHVNEQPFTRELGDVEIPPALTHVIVRAWDNVHKAGDKTFTVKLPGR